ncbi:GIY-YIG nuclease family protein [[Eubacterium] cellulosolvens]
MKGTYVVLLEILKKIDMRVGRLGFLHVPQGYYLYVGSAMGSGGASYESRIKRHYRKNKKRFWHIDYLTTHNDVVICFADVVIENKKIECELATYLKTVFNGKILFKNFGSTDCNCGGHLLNVSCVSNQEIQERIETIRHLASRSLS